MNFDYRDKVIVITGGAGGIAGAFAFEAAERGARLALVDIRAEAAARAAAALSGNGHRGFAGDLTDDDEVERILGEIDAAYGRIDVLINNVGMASAERFDVRSVESIRLETEVNLLSPLVLTRLALPLLGRARDPRVITTVSLGGIFPLGEAPIYTASKFGLRGAMLSIGLDLRHKGITAGSVLPSATDTRMLRQEAIDGGNSLQFLDPPQQPRMVARAMMRMLDRPRLEIYPKPSESVLIRLAMLVPNALPQVMRGFRRRGERGMARYLAELERDGHVVREGDALVLKETA
ncbi:SDR family NAD(P)-dependent oxidoreductase [Microbacterium hominis]|uniref:SDR family oxidoreductase n=1 Tax=Microbacterium hominis TaxID=162426 RepID=A0A7D4Q2A8_9MICO|nr:SDR family oxidoreductase [Microbacterium hominis]QKJ19371.1 SDR family oxidoreductase [Microbacterium hominis]